MRAERYARVIDSIGQALRHEAVPQVAKSVIAKMDGRVTGVPDGSVDRMEASVSLLALEKKARTSPTAEAAIKELAAATAVQQRAAQTVEQVEKDRSPPWWQWLAVGTAGLAGLAAGGAAVGALALLLLPGFGGLAILGVMFGALFGAVGAGKGVARLCDLARDVRASDGAHQQAWTALYKAEEATLRAAERSLNELPDVAGAVPSGPSPYFDTP